MVVLTFDLFKCNNDLHYKTCENDAKYIVMFTKIQCSSMFALFNQPLVLCLLR